MARGRQTDFFFDSKKNSSNKTMLSPPARGRPSGLLRLEVDQHVFRVLVVVFSSPKKTLGSYLTQREPTGPHWLEEVFFDQ